MKKKMDRFKIGAIVLLVLAASLFGRAAYAADGDGVTVEVVARAGTYVLFKLEFPTEISGSFAGTIGGKHFDCFTVPQTILLCFGPLRYTEPVFLTIYDKDTGEVVVQTLITPPPKKESEEQAPPPSGGDDAGDNIGDDILINENINEECIECL